MLEDLYRHLEWADAAIWTCVAGLENAADEKLNSQLNHLHMVQRAFLSVWQGHAFDPESVSGLAGIELGTWVRDFYPQARQELESAHESQLDAVVELPWRQMIAERLGFDPRSTTLRDTFTQVYFHTAHHRGQVSTRLRELGATPPTVDYIAWVWRGRPAASWPD